MNHQDLPTHIDARAARETQSRSSLPLMVWTSPSGLAGYEISRIASRVILAAPWGTGGLEEIEIYYRALSRLIDQSSESALVLVLDYGKVVNFGPEARRIFARTIGNLRTPLGGIVFVSLTPVQRLFVGLGRRMGNYPWPVRICSSREEGIQTARFLVQHSDTLEEGIPSPAIKGGRSGFLARFVVGPQARKLKAALADFPWDSQSPVPNPYGDEHPFHDLFEMWRTIKADLDQLEQEGKRRQSAHDAVARAHADAEQCMRAILRASQSAVILYDPDRRIRMANPAATRLLHGEDRPEGIPDGTDWLAHIHPADQQRILDSHRRRLLDPGLPASFECRIVTSTGEERVVDVSVEPVVGTSLRAACLHDVTLQRRLEIDRFRLDAEIERLAGRVARLEDSARDSGADDPSSASSPSSPMRVLVVEDDEPLRGVLCEYLDAVGCESLHAGGAAEAISLVESELVDIALIDLQLDEVDGYELVRSLRAHPRFGAHPVVLMTGQSFDEAPPAARGSGVDRHIVKPFLMEELVRELARLHDDYRNTLR